MSYNEFYQAEWGWFSKDKFKISSAGIDYNNKHIALEAVTSISWQATTIWYNGIFPKDEYKIDITSSKDEIFIYLTKKKIFYEIIDSIWQAVGNNLMIEMILRCANGETLQIGQIEFNDVGIFLENNKFLSSDRKFFTWNESLSISSENGSVIISSKQENYSSSVSYITDNAPVFEILIRQFFKNLNYNNPRLSSLLQ